MKDYPCDCEGMKWLVDNYDVVQYLDGKWVLAWIELDKTKKGTNIERFGVKFTHCLFCGKRIG